MKLILKILIIIILLFISYFVFIENDWLKHCSEKGTCYKGDCSVNRFNARNCQNMIDFYKRQSEIAFECKEALDNYIRENNLTCADSIQAHPLDQQRTKYKCCRVCYFINEIGNDYSEEVCKIKQQEKTK